VAAPGGAVLVKPADKAIDVALIPTYTWRKLAGASDYDFQLSRNEGFTDIAMEKTSIADTVFTPPTALPVSSKRWWRTRGRNVGGTGAWSPAWSFTSVPEIPAVPAAIAPAAAAEQLAIPVTFLWHKSARSVIYRVQILAGDAKTVAFDTLIAKGDTALVLDHKLDYAADYAWRVRGENPGGPSEWSASREFSTLDQPAVPGLIAPKADSLNAPVSLTLVWHKAARAATYKVQVSENEAFTGTLVLSDSNLTDTTRAIGPLQNAKAYWWRVRGKNAAGVGVYSPARKFTTIILIAPPAPTLASPTDDAPGVSPSPVLKWHPSARATAYRLQVSLSPTFATLASDEAGIKDTTKAVGPLKNNEQYFWRVSARNDAGVSVFSEIRTFTVSAAAAAEPVPVSPNDNAVNQPQELDLVWKQAQNAANYRVQVSLKADFTTKVDDSDVADTSLHVEVLAYGQTYYWRVRSQNSAGSSDYSDTRKLTVVIQAPSAPALVIPADNAIDQKRNLTLKWNPAARASLYRFQVSTSASFNTIAVDDSTLADTSKSLADLKANTQFFWRVRAKNAGGVSAWSEIRAFKTEEATGTAIRPVGVGEGFRVVSGRSAKGAELEFSVKRAGPVRFTVINPANGRTFELVNREMQAGTYRIAVGPRASGRGVYFLSMASGNFRQTQKVFLP
jgi:hypothetical protein